MFLLNNSLYESIALLLSKIFTLYIYIFIYLIRIFHMNNKIQVFCHWLYRYTYVYEQKDFILFYNVQNLLFDNNQYKIKIIKQ